MYSNILQRIWFEPFWPIFLLWNFEKGNFPVSFIEEVSLEKELFPYLLILNSGSVSAKLSWEWNLFCLNRILKHQYFIISILILTFKNTWSKRLQLRQILSDFFIQKITECFCSSLFWNTRLEKVTTNTFFADFWKWGQKGSGLVLRGTRQAGLVLKGTRQAGLVLQSTSQGGTGAAKHQSGGTGAIKHLSGGSGAAKHQKGGFWRDVL